MLFKNNPVFLNLSGGPAIAAMLLSAQHIREPRKGARARLYWFLFLAPIFWAILVLQTEWGGGIRAPLRFHPWLVIAALIPVGCIRGLVQRSRCARLARGRSLSFA